MTDEQMIRFCDGICERGWSAGFDPVELLTCLANATMLLINTHPDAGMQRHMARVIVEMLEANFPAHERMH